ncbi:MAG TPA: hypothetical protein VF115_12365 [Acidimicrobiia bacterium]
MSETHGRPHGEFEEAFTGHALVEVFGRRREEQGRFEEDTPPDLIMKRGGRIVERGTHEDVTALDAGHAALYHSQFAGHDLAFESRSNVTQPFPGHPIARL